MIFSHNIKDFLNPALDRYHLNHQFETPRKNDSFLYYAECIIFEDILDVFSALSDPPSSMIFFVDHGSPYFNISRRGGGQVVGINIHLIGYYDLLIVFLTAYGKYVIPWFMDKILINFDIEKSVYFVLIAYIKTTEVDGWFQKSTGPHWTRKRVLRNPCIPRGFRKINQINHEDIKRDLSRLYLNTSPLVNDEWKKTSD